MTVAVAVDAPRAVKMALAVIVKMALHGGNDTPSHFRYELGLFSSESPAVSPVERWLTG